MSASNHAAAGYRALIAVLISGMLGTVLANLLRPQLPALGANPALIHFIAWPSCILLLLSFLMWKKRMRQSTGQSPCCEHDRGR